MHRSHAQRLIGIIEHDDVVGGSARGDAHDQMALVRDHRFQIFNVSAADFFTEESHDVFGTSFPSSIGHENIPRSGTDLLIAQSAEHLEPSDAAQTAPLVDLLQSTQDRLYSRLFIS